jgi:hypothetical protein
LFHLHVRRARPTQQIAWFATEDIGRWWMCVMAGHPRWRQRDGDIDLPCRA